MPFVKETSNKSPLGKKLWTTRINTPEGVLRTFTVEGATELEAKRNADKIKRSMLDAKYYQENRHLFNPPPKIPTANAIGMIATKIKELGIYKNNTFEDKLKPLLRNECRLYLSQKYNYLCDIDKDQFFQRGLEVWIKQRHFGVVPKLLFTRYVTEVQSIRIWEYLKVQCFLNVDNKVTDKILTAGDRFVCWVNDNISTSVEDIGNEIKKVLVHEYKKQNRDEIKISTMNNKIKGIRLILETGVKMNLLSKCPALKTKGEGEISPRKPINEEMFQNLMKNADTYLRFILMILWFTGMRRNEVFSLQLRDIDLDNMEIKVRPENSKTGEIRIVLIQDNETFLLLLRKFMIEYYDTKLKVFVKRENQTEKEFLFRDATGARVKGARTALMNLVKKCGYKNISPHIFRHTYVTEQVNKGCNPKETATLVGHKTVRSTMRYLYGGVVRDLRPKFAKSNIDLSAFNIAV